MSTTFLRGMSSRESMSANQPLHMALTRKRLLIFISRRERLKNQQSQLWRRGILISWLGTYRLKTVRRVLKEKARFQKKRRQMASHTIDQRRVLPWDRWQLPTSIVKLTLLDLLEHQWHRHNLRFRRTGIQLMVPGGRDQIQIHGRTELVPRRNLNQQMHRTELMCLPHLLQRCRMMICTAIINQLSNSHPHLLSSHRYQASQNCRRNW